MTNNPYRSPANPYAAPDSQSGSGWPPAQQAPIGQTNTALADQGGHCPGFGGDGVSLQRSVREFPQLARAGVIGMVVGILVYLVGVFLPFASSDSLVISGSGEEISGSFATTNLLESNAPAWISLLLLGAAVGIVLYAVFGRKIQDRLGVGIVVGTALTASVGLVIFLLSIAFDGGLRNFYDVGGAMGAGQIVMFVGAGITLVSSVAATIGAARD